MIFWDASAIIPLCIAESHTEGLKEVLREDSAMAVWWGTPVECYSAFARLRREGTLDSEGEETARKPLRMLEQSWTEIRPGRQVREQALRCVSVHELKAADALQLAAAIVWTGNNPRGYSFVCLDRRLKTAAQKEGLDILPDTP